MDNFISNDPTVIARKITNYIELIDDPFEDYSDVEIPDHGKEFINALTRRELFIDPTVTVLLKTIRDTPDILRKVTLVKHFTSGGLKVLARLDRVMVFEPKEQILSGENDHIDTETPEGLTAICEKYDAIYLCLDMKTNEDARLALEARGLDF